MTAIPAGRLQSLGQRPDQINSILVINLDREERRWRLVTREVARYRSADGAPLSSMIRRLSAVDARDGRAVAATADVDATYCVGDQLFVQPDDRLSATFRPDEPVRMTRQEVAVARSHIEAWKLIAAGSDHHVLVLEDDVWFRPGAKASIDRGWRDAVSHSRDEQGPQFVYLSYSLADLTAPRHRSSDAVFRPTRGLWFLSGYVLSQEGASALLHAMPVVGPVDLWMNYRLAELDAFALGKPALLQRMDTASSNAYSMLPYLARAGVVDAERELQHPGPPTQGPVIGWSAGRDRESLAMALSMLGLRVRVFDTDEPTLTPQDLEYSLKTFDALVDPPLDPRALRAVSDNPDAVVVVERGASVPTILGPNILSPHRTATIEDPAVGDWRPICRLLGVNVPVDRYPVGTTPALRAFRDTRPVAISAAGTHRGDPRDEDARTSGATDGAEGVASSELAHRSLERDDTPWVLPTSDDWTPSPPRGVSDAFSRLVLDAPMSSPTQDVNELSETFPGNLATFSPANVEYRDDGAHLRLVRQPDLGRPFRSGAIATTRQYLYGRFQARIKPAPGSGAVTGLFLHRASPRQEIDLEFVGAHSTRILTNVYFNPGDDGTELSYGYRGTPHWIELGFDATADFHDYAIDWHPHGISWLVDGRVVHQRTSWNPTPIPHLPMRLHANLWAPRSIDLAGQFRSPEVPREAVFADVRVTS
ncbi:family 16 glycosylhydrolase [Nocardioides currus]|nr:family 16 glycosylhydrolase [Nocardioides currus]